MILENSPNKSEYLEIRFFDPTDGLEPEYICKFTVKPQLIGH